MTEKQNAQYIYIFIFRRQLDSRVRLFSQIIIRYLAGNSVLWVYITSLFYNFLSSVAVVLSTLFISINSSFCGSLFYLILIFFFLHKIILYAFLRKWQRESSFIFKYILSQNRFTRYQETDNYALFNYFPHRGHVLQYTSAMCVWGALAQSIEATYKSCCYSDSAYFPLICLCVRITLTVNLYIKIKVLNEIIKK